MDGWTIFYGGLTLAVVLLSMWTRRPGTLRAAGFVLTCWMLYNLMQRTLTPFELAHVAAYLDSFGICFGLILTAHQPRRWTYVFVGVHATDLFVHLWMLFQDIGASRSYYTLLNGFYLVLLCTIATPSIAHLWRRWQRGK